MAGSIQKTEVVLRTLSLGLTPVTGQSGGSGEVLTAISSSFSPNTQLAGGFDWLEERFPRAQDRQWKDEVVDLYRDALHFFQEAAVLKDRSHDKEDSVRLLALGGRLTRAKALPGLEGEREKIFSEIEALKQKRKRLRWHVQESARSGQYFWHRATFYLKRAGLLKARVVQERRHYLTRSAGSEKNAEKSRIYILSSTATRSKRNLSGHSYHQA